MPPTCLWKNQPEFLQLLLVEQSRHINNPKVCFATLTKYLKHCLVDRVLSDESVMEVPLPVSTGAAVSGAQIEVRTGATYVQAPWHPLIIKLCIATWAKSKGGYEALRSGGFLLLPHPRTIERHRDQSQTARR